MQKQSILQSTLHPYIAEENRQQLNVASLTFQEPICDPIGFRNHEGECWNDAIQEIFLFSDGLKELTQPLLYSLNTMTIHDRVADVLAYHTNITNDSQKSKYIQSYIDYITLMKIRFVTHYKYILAQSIVKENANLITRKRRMSLTCGVGAAAKMTTVFKGESNTYRAGLISEYSNLVFTNLCSILRIPYVVAPFTKGYTLDPSHTAFFVSAIAYQTSDLHSIGGHVMAIFRCNSVWYWYDDNTGVHPIPQKAIELCFAEPEFGYAFDGTSVQFLKVARKISEVELSQNENLTHAVERGGIMIDVTHRLVDDTWIPSTDIHGIHRIYGIKTVKGVFVVRPKRSVAQIMRSKKSRTMRRRQRRQRTRKNKNEI